MLEIELILNIIFLAVSIFIYYYRKSMFKNKVIRKKHSKLNHYINLIFIGMIIVIGLSYFLNLEVYIQKKFLENNTILILITINQIGFWTSIVINARSLRFKREETAVDFDYPTKREAHEGDIEAGKIMHKNRTKYSYRIKLRDLERHMFVTGMTGSGKSTFLQNFIVNFKKKYKIPILLVEFKGEYHYLQKEIEHLLICKVGENFTINIFDPEGDDPQVHAERLFDIFRSGGTFEDTEYSPQMEKVFAETLYRVCKDPKKRNWKGFYEEAEKYIHEMLTEKGDYTFQKSKHAVENRIRRYSLSTLKHIFEKKSGLNVKEIFKHNVLLDLSNIIKIGGQKPDTLFFLNTILKYLWDLNIESGSRDYKGIKHITIIEDAQYFGSQATTKKSKISSYIEDIALLLRGTGECLISLATRPAVSAEILANCGVFIAFQEHMQKDYVEDLINLNQKEKKLLSLLDVGQCLIRVNSIGRPFLMQIPYKKRTWLTNEEIEENNQKILSKIRESNLYLEDKLNENISENIKKVNSVKMKLKNLIRKKFGSKLNREKTDTKFSIENNKLTSKDYEKFIHETEKEHDELIKEIQSKEVNNLEVIQLTAVKLGLEGEDEKAFINLQKFIWDKTENANKSQNTEHKTKSKIVRRI